MTSGSHVRLEIMRGHTMFKAYSALLAFIVGFATLIGLAPIEPSAAQQAPAATLPSDDQLDALLAARKWDDLGTALSLATSGEPVVRMMSWLRSRIDSGGGSMLGFIYANNLWSLGSAKRIDDPDREARVRVAAGVIILYTYELIAIDGAKCGDRASPHYRMELLAMNNGPALAYLRAKPDDIKAKVVEMAIALEKKTAPLRKADDWLCRRRMELMRAGIEAQKAREAQSPTGQVGTTRAVDPLIDHVPGFLTPELYLPVQERARSNMKADLLKFLQ
jgi:hypothetical protein